jgi:hypothetical protein
MSQESYLRAIARFSNDIKTGAIDFNYRTGECGPGPATQLQSWGSACPPGLCLPEDLPPRLNNWFAGDRSGCRELPYTIHIPVLGSATLDVASTVERNSKVTMCPTRMMVTTNYGVASGPFEITKIQFGNQNQIVGGPLPAGMFDPGAFQVVPFVPECLKAGLPFSIGVNLLAGAAVTSDIWITFIGPAIG